MIKILIAKDFSDVPAGRYRSDGPFSGERFRDDVLIPALRRDQTVEVWLDGVEGFGSSFLEEAFGGLVRKGEFPYDDLIQQLSIKANDESLGSFIEEIKGYISAENPALKFRP